MDVNRQLLVILVATMIVLGLALLVPTAITSSKLWKALQSRHPEVWKRLGEPSLRPMSARKSRELRAFVREKRYVELNDPELDSLARTLSRLSSIGIVLFWVGVAGVVVAAVLSVGT